MNKHIPKTFAFRCEWIELPANSDGFSYAIDKTSLLMEIKRRELTYTNKALNIKIVPVSLELWKVILIQSNKVFNTLLEKHPLDFELLYRR